VSAIEDLERKRRAVQRRLDSRISAAQRNQCGRYATPPALALDMLSLARTALGPDTPLRFLDPALGTGVFFYALITAFGRGRVERATGFEIDPDTAADAEALWSDHGLAVQTGDFCRARPPAGGRGRSTLVVCNPPYVRHHHLAPPYKRFLRRRVSALGYDLSGLAGLYAYFLLLADPWLVRGGVGVWIIPAELLDVGYGRDLKTYLARRVTLLKVHRFDPSTGNGHLGRGALPQGSATAHPPGRPRGRRDAYRAATAASGLSDGSRSRRKMGTAVDAGADARARRPRARHPR
jgi:hypothetical protein